MQFANLTPNRVVVAAVFFVGLFAALVAAFPLSDLNTVLNGFFAGSMAAIVVAYWRILVNSIAEITPYNRVRQMTLGFFLAWIAISLQVVVSVYLTSSAITLNTTVLTIASKYIAVIAAWLQVTAPDFGLGIFHGRDRKVFYLAAIVGGYVAIAVVAAQTFQVLG